MSEAVIVALIAAAASVIGQLIIGRKNQADTFARLDKQSELSDARLEKAQAVTDAKLDELTREVREHNNFARRVPVIEEQIKVANHRIEDLEKAVAK